MPFNGRPRGTIESLKLHGIDKTDKKYKEYAQPDVSDQLITNYINPPNHYSARTKKAWERILPNLLAMRVLTEQDLDTLQTGFDAFEEMVKAQRAIKAFDKNFDPTDSSQVKTRRSLSQWMLASMGEANKVFCRYGLTPTERSRLDIIPEKKKDDDPLSLVLDA